MNINISHQKDQRKFHTYIDNMECYLLYNNLGPAMMEIFEVFVPVIERQQGIGTQLVEEALRYAQLNNLLVVPNCHFVADYMNDHPEFKKMTVEV